MGFSVEDILQEVKDELKELAKSFADFKGRVVMKEELELWQEAQRTTRRWAIGTLLSMLTIAITAVAIVVNVI